MPDPQFYLAWVDETDDTFDPDVHCQTQENLFSIQIDHREGECATATVVILNPRIGLLNTGRKLWVWISCYEGTGVDPLFFGRLTAIPENIFGQQISLVFLAKPTDYEAQRNALAEAADELPWFDRVFVDKSLWQDADGNKALDPDAVIETRTQRWHVSRGEDGGPLTVSLSDILVGEGTTWEFTPDDALHGTVGMSFGQPPLLSQTVKATVNWDQTGFTDQLPISLPPQIRTFNASLFSDWPKPGNGLGGGWAAGPSTGISDLDGADGAKSSSSSYQFQNGAKKHRVGDVMSAQHSVTATIPTNAVGFGQPLTGVASPGVVYQGGGPYEIKFPTASTIDPDDEEVDINIPAHAESTWMDVIHWRLAPRLTITTEGGKAKRTESIIFTLIPDMQPVLGFPDPAPTSALKPYVMQGADVGVPIDDGGSTDDLLPPLYIDSSGTGTPPIGDTGLPYYFPTARGLESVQYAVLWARAQIRGAARVAEVWWDVPFERGRTITCRDNAQFTYREFPGGIVSGKVISVSLQANVQTGQRRASIRIGATPGYGGTVSDVSMTGNDYVEDDYIEDGHFVNSEDIIALDGDDVGLSAPTAETGNGPFPLKYEDVIKVVQVNSSYEEQLELLQEAGQRCFVSVDDWGTGALVLEGIADRAQQIMRQAFDGEAGVHLELVPLSSNGFEHNYPITVTKLKLPKTIDFEAPSTV